MNSGDGFGNGAARIEQGFPGLRDPAAGVETHQADFNDGAGGWIPACGFQVKHSETLGTLRQQQRQRLRNLGHRWRSHLNGWGASSALGFRGNAALGLEGQIGLNPAPDLSGGLQDRWRSCIQELHALQAAHQECFREGNIGLSNGDGVQASPLHHPAIEHHLPFRARPIGLPVGHPCTNLSLRRGCRRGGGLWNVGGRRCRGAGRGRRWSLRRDGLGVGLLPLQGGFEGQRNHADHNDQSDQSKHGDPPHHGS